MNVRQKIGEGWEELSKAIADCLEEPTEAAVHHARTRSRRMEALVSAVLKAHADDERLTSAGWALMRTLKKIRREAGIVRDLDIYLKLLESLCALEGSSYGGETKKIELALQRDRGSAAAALKNKIEEQGHKLEKRGQNFLQRVGDLSENGQQMDTAARVAAEFCKTRAAIPELSAGNLHDFRKRLKMSRYIAETNVRSPENVRLVKKLVRVQDAIGAWHDWDAMAAETVARLGKKGAALLGAIEDKRAAAYLKAIKIARQAQQELLRDATQAHPS